MPASSFTTKAPPQTELHGKWKSSLNVSGLEEAMSKMELGREDSYPERPGQPDCSHYVRNGFCGYGNRCRFNHPRDCNMVLETKNNGTVCNPEWANQNMCQHFLKNGTCKFGDTCKYYHPNPEEGSLSQVVLNYYGYPLRPGETECSYYVKTGVCKFGVTCKFHHPQPSGFTTLSSLGYFSPVQSPLIHPAQYREITNWQVSSSMSSPGSYVQGPFGLVFLPPGAPPLPNYTHYAPPSSSTAPVAPRQLSSSAPAYQARSPSISFTSHSPDSTQKEHIFPERPGKQECQFYLRTGNCKYGSACKYHHPPDGITPRAICVLSPIGLPLRPGDQICTFYTQHGWCKFGPTCKFDHPMRTFAHNPSIPYSYAPTIPPAHSLNHPSPFPYASSPCLIPPMVEPVKDKSSTVPPTSEITSDGSSSSSSSNVAQNNNTHFKLSEDSTPTNDPHFKLSEDSTPSDINGSQ